MPTIIYILPYLLGAVMLLVGEFRDRLARRRGAGVKERGYSKIWALPLSAAVGGAVLGSAVALATSKNPHIILIGYNVSWSLFFVAASMRLVKRKVNLLACAGICVVVMTISFFFTKGLL
jgi:hypothetical protein